MSHEQDMMKMVRQAVTGFKVVERNPYAYYVTYKSKIVEGPFKWLTAATRRLCKLRAEEVDRAMRVFPLDVRTECGILVCRAFSGMEDPDKRIPRRAWLDDVPKEIVNKVLELGPVEWGATDEYTADEHAEHMREIVLKTADHFNQQGPQKMHGLYLDGTDRVACHTGASPNSPIIARVLAGLWNHLNSQLSIEGPKA